MQEGETTREPETFSSYETHSGNQQHDTVGEPLILKRLKLQSERCALAQRKALPTRLKHAQC